MDAVAEVKGRLNIEDVVAQYVQLKRAGRNFKGNSPWTNEKTPSFIVSPEKQIWHDFSSGKGGDMFSFIMEMEGLDFRGALEHLARQAGVDLDEFKGESNNLERKRKARAMEALELATRFYQKQLIVNNTALDYLKKRKFTRQTIIDWRVGYSPSGSSTLTTFLTKHGFTTDEVRAAGLSTLRSGRPVDMFHGRIMIPLCDANGRVVGFTARLVADDPNAPKYINTPATSVYDKSRNIFGLHLAKESIRKTTYVVAVEGQIDVIASHQAGVKNVIACGGTAMTEMHLRELKRFTGDIRLCFDADRAGISATERVIPLAQKVEVNLKIVSIESGLDPDELVQKSVQEWQKAIEQAQYAPDWLIDRYSKELDLASAQGKKLFTDALLSTVRRLRDQVEQEHYLKKIATTTDTSFDAVKAKFGSSDKSDQPVLRKPKINPATSVPDSAIIEFRRLQDHLLAMILMQPKLRDLLASIEPEVFSDGDRRQVFDFLLANPDFKGEPLQAKKLQQQGDYVKIISLQFEELYQNSAYEDLREQAINLKRRLIDRYIKIQKQILSKAMQQTSDEKELHKLMRQVDKLNTFIK